MVKTRPLRESDREDILEIARNTWEGHDWLPEYFDEWLKDSSCHTLAIEEDGRVAALANLKLIEKGITGWMEGLRVHPDFRGRGFASTITDLLVELAKKLGVKRLRYTTATVNVESLHLAEKIGMKRLFQMGVYWDSKIDRVPKKEKFENLEKMEIELNHKRIETSGLIPSNVLLVDWKAYDATIEGFKEFGEIEVWAHSERNQLESVSIGTERHDMNGPIWAITIYTENGNLFLEQLSKQISLAKENGFGRIILMFPYEFYKNLHKLEWMKDEEKSDIGVVLLEKDISL